MNLRNEDVVSASSPCCRNGSFFVILNGDPSFVGDRLILYLSDGRSTRRVSTTFFQSLELEFPFLFPGTYTLQGFIIDKTNTYVCSSDYYSIVIPSQSSDYCPIIMSASAGQYVDSSGGFVSLAICPKDITTTGPGTPYTFTCDWIFTASPSDLSRSCFAGSGGILNAFLAGTYSASIKTFSGIGCPSTCCSQSIQIFNDNGTGVATCGAVPEYTVSLPSAACATDGFVSVTAPRLLLMRAIIFTI